MGNAHATGVTYGDLRDLQRRGECWQLVAPGPKKVQPFDVAQKDEGPPETPMTMLFDYGSFIDVWSMLARPSSGFASSSPTTGEVSTGKGAPRRVASPLTELRTLSRLESLPTETLLTIASELNVMDLLAFGLASPYLWPLALDRCAACSRACWAPLAGTELFCLSSWATDLPPPVAAQRPCPRPFTGSPAQRRRLANYSAYQSFRALRHYLKVAKTYGAALKAPAFLPAWDARAAGWAREATGPARARALREELEHTLLGVGSRDGECDAPWVLRNLTGKKFVRCRGGRLVTPTGPSKLWRTAHPRQEPALAGTSAGGSFPGNAKGQRGFVDHPDADGLRVLDVLLLRTCWTRPPLARENYPPALHFLRGEWAGHCFDIVPWEPKRPLAGWEDCTAEVVEQAHQVANALAAYDELRVYRT